jgi:hypothetical protein
MTHLWSACAKRPLAPVHNLVSLVEGFPLASLMLWHGLTPYAWLLYDDGTPRQDTDAETVEYMENATKDVACALVEYILCTTNTVPPEVVSHVQDTIRAVLPAKCWCDSRAGPAKS